jgi:hypothetical protein
MECSIECVEQTSIASSIISRLSLSFKATISSPNDQSPLQVTRSRLLCQSSPARFCAPERSLNPPILLPGGSLNITLLYSNHPSATPSRSLSLSLSLSLSFPTMSNKDGHPPSYPKPVHQDAGPYYGPGSPPPQNFSPAPSGAPHQQYYQQGGAQQDYYGNGPPAGGYYGGGPQHQMNYGPQTQHVGPGYYPNNIGHGRKSGGMGGGICAGIMGALACCCCLDFIF